MFSLATGALQPPECYILACKVGLGLGTIVGSTHHKCVVSLFIGSDSVMHVPIICGHSVICKIFDLLVSLHHHPQITNVAILNLQDFIYTCPLPTTHVHYMCTTCALHVHYMCYMSTTHVHYMCTTCPLHMSLETNLNSESAKVQSSVTENGLSRLSDSDVQISHDV